IQADVKTLQNCLFPPQSTAPDSYFSNFFIKSSAQYNEDDEELRIKIKESFAATREIFPAARDTAFILQPPRWPTECQFSFESCKFRIQKAKEGTGRVVMWMMGIANSYTMETSFAGSILGARTDSHFSTQDYEQMGKSFCQTLLDFYDEDPRKEKLRTKIIERLTKEGSNADEPTNIPLSDYSSDDGDTSTSSGEEADRNEEKEEEEEDDEATQPQPPPPSPAPTLRRQRRSSKTSPLPSRAKVTAVASRSPRMPRQTLPVNRKYDLEIREYTQFEIDHPEFDRDNIVEQRVIWCKPQRVQCVAVVDLAQKANAPHVAHS
ncbi:hypothetical protein GWI33_012803, partial [Rhynchophorus ferrugineus]